MLFECNVAITTIGCYNTQRAAQGLLQGCAAHKLTQCSQTTLAKYIIILILMQEGIPIVVSKKKQKQPDLIFKIATPQLIDKMELICNYTAPKARNSNIQPRHQTLDSDNLVARTRRISSSAASKRFPKDFFKEEVIVSNPSKTNRSKRKQYEIDFADTFSKKTIITMQVDEGQKKEPAQEDTPKFTCKKGQELSTKEKLLQYIKNKKLEVNTAVKGKYNTCPEGETKEPLGIINKQQKTGFFTKQQGNEFDMVPSFNITLGQKESLINMMQKQKKVRKKQEISEKENNNYLVLAPELSKRENLAKFEGFRIRRKIIS